VPLQLRCLKTYLYFWNRHYTLNMMYMKKNPHVVIIVLIKEQGKSLIVF
jgi:hypothetical protein